MIINDSDLKKKYESISGKSKVKTRKSEISLTLMEKLAQLILVSHIAEAN